MSLVPHRSTAVKAAFALLLFVLTAPALRADVSGRLAGWVRDDGGVPRMGAAVALLNAEGRVLRRVFTDEMGAFEIDELFPGSYAIRVSLSSFAPALRDSILIRSGIRTVLDVNLRGLFSSLQLVYPGGGEIRDMTEDWKWVLRASHSSRPVLRFGPADESERETRHVMRKLQGTFSETRAYAQVSAGGGVRASALANESDLGTSFAVATSLFGNNDVTVAGNVGHDSVSAAPSTGFRTTYRRGMGPVSPELSLTVRQMHSGRVAAGAVLGQAGGRAGPNLESYTLGFGDQVEISEATRLEYGFLYESVRFIDRLDFVSPYAKVAHRLSPGREVALRFASGAPRPDRIVRGGERLRRDVSNLGMFPRVALRDGAATVQRTEHIEASYREEIGKSVVEAAVYQDRISDAALSAYVPGGHFADGNVLPDLFSRGTTINGGDHRIRGMRVSYARKLRDRLEAAIGYGLGGALTPGSDQLESADAAELRDSLHVRRAHMIMASVSAEAPGAGTQIVTTYQWVSRPSAMAVDLYNDFSAQSQPGLNLVIRQPLPFSGSLPGKLEATADIRNLLRSGYLPIQTHDGQTMYLLQAVRSYRGALSFVF